MGRSVSLMNGMQAQHLYAVVLFPCRLQCRMTVCSTGVTLDKDHAGNVFKKVHPSLSPKKTDSLFEIPHTFVQVSRSQDAELYLRKVGCYDAYLANRVDIRYDIKKDRAVFLVKKRGVVVDAVGRLINGVGPKWYGIQAVSSHSLRRTYSCCCLVKIVLALALF